MQNQEKQQCTAKSKRSGKQCRNPPVKGKKVCRMHGGTNDGAPKDNQNAKTHGAYTKFLDDDDIAASVEEEAVLESLDDDIKANAIMRSRGFRLSKSPDPEVKQIGLKLIENALSRSRKLKLSRLEMKKAADSDDINPLPWVDN